MTAVTARPAETPAGASETLRRSEDVFSLSGVTWEAYSLLRDSLDANGRGGLRLTYDGGSLDLMSPTPAHEHPKMLLHGAVTTLAEEFRRPLRSLGSTTFRKAAQQRGFEPDQCCFLSREKVAALPRRVPKGFDVATAPPPDLGIEIDVTHGSIPRLPLYATWGIGEVWRVDDAGGRVSVMRLDGRGGYAPGESGLFLGLTAELLTDALAFECDDDLAWTDAFRRLVRERLTSPGCG